MVTILISGSGTGVGKTFVAAALARIAAAHGRSVQIIKPVQTGLKPGEPSDAETSASLAELRPDCAHTLRRYPEALAPLAAAAKAGKKLDMAAVEQEILALPEADVRLVEGAGGVAVPLGPDGWDWVDFAAEIRADAMVLVVPDELGAINQARLAYFYAQGKHHATVPSGILLNALKPPPTDVAESTRQALQSAAVPVWGVLAADAKNLGMGQPLLKLLVG